MNYDTQLRSLVIEPLEAINGELLLHVNYWLINSEQPEFHVEEPNASGLYAVTLMFADKTLEVFPAWNKQLRDSNTSHIQALLVFGNKASEELLYSENITMAEANETTLWHEAILQPLSAIEIYGIRQSPQLIRFIFPSKKIVIAIGYSGDVPLIGDGDEILVFPDEQWHIQEKTLIADWTKLWKHEASE